MKHEGRLEGREWHPRDVRSEADCDILVHCEDGDLAARIVNLSNEGFRLHSADRLQPGWEVTLEAAGHDPVKALICWACGEEAGGVFAEPVAL
jgi:hypothetical protein